MASLFQPFSRDSNPKARRRRSFAVICEADEYFNKLRGAKNGSWCWRKENVNDSSRHGGMSDGEAQSERDGRSGPRTAWSAGGGGELERLEVELQAEG